ASSNPCTPGAGNNRLYAVSVFDGRPVDNLANQSNATIADRWTTLAQGGIAPGVTFLFPAPQTAVNGSPPPPPPRPTSGRWSACRAPRFWASARISIAALRPYGVNRMPTRAQVAAGLRQHRMRGM